MQKIFIETKPNRNQLIFGIVLVLAFGLLGGMALKNDSIKSQVLVARQDIPSGIEVTRNMFDLVEIQGVSELAAISEFTDSLVLKRPLRTGEILQSQNLISAQRTNYVIPISLSETAIPANLRVGDTVQIWHSGVEINPNYLGEAEVLEIVDTELGDTVRISVAVTESQITEILQADSEVRLIATL